MALSPELRESLIAAYGASVVTSDWVKNRPDALNSARADFVVQVARVLYDHTKFYFGPEERESFGPILTAAEDHLNRMLATDGFRPTEPPAELTED